MADPAKVAQALMAADARMRGRSSAGNSTAWREFTGWRDDANGVRSMDQIAQDTGRPDIPGRRAIPPINPATLVAPSKRTVPTVKVAVSQQPAVIEINKLLADPHRFMVGGTGDYNPYQYMKTLSGDPLTGPPLPRARPEPPMDWQPATPAPLSDAPVGDVWGNGGRVGHPVDTGLAEGFAQGGLVVPVNGAQPGPSMAPQQAAVAHALLNHSALMSQQTDKRSARPGVSYLEAQGQNTSNMTAGELANALNKSIF